MALNVSNRDSEASGHFLGGGGGGGGGEQFSFYHFFTFLMLSLSNRHAGARDMFVSQQLLY